MSVSVEDGIGDPIISPRGAVGGGLVRRQKHFAIFPRLKKKKKSHTEVGKEFPNDGEATVEMVAVVVVAAFSIGFWVEGHRGHTFAFSCERESIVGRRRGGSTFPRFHVAGFSAR